MSESNFKRAWPFGTQDFSATEIDRICDRYRDVNGNIDYRALHEEVTDPADTILDAPIPTSSELFELFLDVGASLSFGA